MATLEHAAATALGLPEVTEGHRYGQRTWFRAGRAFGWDRPFSKADLKRFGDAVPPEGPILAVAVEDLAERAALLAAAPGVFFTIAHFDGYPAVQIRQEKIRRGGRCGRQSSTPGWLARPRPSPPTTWEAEDVDPILEPLSMYGAPSDRPAPSWSWVDGQLRDGGTYWVVVRGAHHPHPRPVWGVWDQRRLLLSIGSPTIVRALEEDPTVTVHLDSGTDVVILEGRAEGPSGEAAAIERYDATYDWDEDVSQYGPLTVIVPLTVIAWRSAGWAGRDGFQTTARWRFPDGPG